MPGYVYKGNPTKHIQHRPAPGATLTAAENEAVQIIREARRDVTMKMLAANREADQIIDEARAEAYRITIEAQQEQDRIVADATAKITLLKEKHKHLKRIIRLEERERHLTEEVRVLQARKDGLAAAIKRLKANAETAAQPGIDRLMRKAEQRAAKIIDNAHTRAARIKLNAKKGK